MTTKELEQQILSLTLAEKTEILQFLLRDFTAFWTGNAHSLQGKRQKSEHGRMLNPGIENELSIDEFELFADQLADEFAGMINSTTPTLSDYAMSRASIYEDHD